MSLVHKYISGAFPEVDEAHLPDQWDDIADDNTIVFPEDKAQHHLFAVVLFHRVRDPFQPDDSLLPDPESHLFYVLLWENESEETERGWRVRSTHFFADMTELAKELDIVKNLVQSGTLIKPE